MANFELDFSDINNSTDDPNFDALMLCLKKPSPGYFIVFHATDEK